MILPGAKFTAGTIDCFGYRIPYAEAGKGDAIVSLPGSAGMEMSVAKDILAQDYRVVELDPPGWGQNPALPGTMKQRHLAVVMAEAIAALGIESYHLIGTSMGGANALWLAYQFPDRVRSIILEAPMLFAGPDEVHSPESFKMVQALVDGAPAPDVSAYPAPPSHPRKPWVDAEYFREQMRRRFKMMAKSDHSYDAPELRAFAKSTSIPILLLMGSNEEILKQSYMDHFLKFVPHAKSVLIDGAVHDIQNTAPEAFADAVRQFVR